MASVVIAHTASMEYCHSLRLWVEYVGAVT